MTRTLCTLLPVLFVAGLLVLPGCKRDEATSLGNDVVSFVEGETRGTLDYDAETLRAATLEVFEVLEIGGITESTDDAGHPIIRGSTVPRGVPVKVKLVETPSEEGLGTVTSMRVRVSSLGDRRYSDAVFARILRAAE